MNIIKTKTLAILQSSPINPFWNDEYPLILNDRFPILLDGVKNCNHSMMENKKTKMLLIRMWILKRENEIRFSIFVNIKHKEEDMGSMLVERLKAENQLFFVWVIDRNNDLK